MSKKVLKLITINVFFLIIPFTVLADNTVEIKNIESSNIIGDAEELSEPEIDDLNITFNNKFHNVGDSISYRIEVANETNLDYKISIEGPNSEYIDYSYTFLNSNEILSKNTSDYIDIKITYKNKILEDNYKESNKIIIKLVNEDEAENPKTGINKPMIFMLLIILGIVTYILLRKKYMLKHINLILLVLLILLPMAIYALNIYTINITSNIEIEKEKYIVTFDPNGGTVDPTEKEVTYLEPYGELPVPVYEGHTFTGWYTERENGDYVDKDTIVTIKGNHTLYAHWEEDIYKVKFDPNGGEITSSFSEKEVIYGHKYGELATAEREGYKFVGWYLEPDDTNNDLITEDSIVKITHDHTLYAHWANADFVVTFDANGGETPVPQKKGITYQKPYGELATTKRVGYDFLGWYTEREGGEEVTSETIVTRAYDHTLYAHWKNKELIVTFDSNGGDTPVPTEKEVTYLEKYGELATTKRTGYKFLGWYTEKENGTLVTSETTVTNPENHTLYAHWDTIVITFDANGIAEAKVPDNKKVEYQKPYGELKDATCDNLEFIGWYLDPENEDNKITSETIVNIPNDHTLYAHWRIKVTFNANGEEDATIPDPVEYKFGETYGSNEGFVDASGSKKFKGWYTKENGGKLITSEDTLISDRNHTLYAHWESIKVTFNPNGGETPVPETKEVLYQKPYGELATVTRPGYTFTGWYTNKDKEDGEVEVTKDTLVSTYEDHTLYAHWKINRVNIVFNSDTTDELNSNLVDQRQDSMNPEIPTKKDYLPPSQVYDVYIPELTSGENNKNIIPGEKSDVDNEYLGFDLGDDGKKVTWGDVYGELPTPTKDGYTFIGWFDKNGKEVTKDTIIEEDEVDIETGKLILSAHWSPNTYTATFDPVDGTLDNSQEKTLSKKVVYGKPIGVVPSASKFGYTFKGWYHEAYHEVEGTNEGVITENSDYDYPSDHTFTPIWHRNIYNLVYDANGGTVSPASKKVEVGNIYGILATPTKDGSAFTGWYTKREGGKKVTWETVTEQSDNDVTIYAHWKEGYVLVDYNTSYIYQEDTKLIGSTYGSMPTPTREGYSFAGWYTKENGGEKITENDVITSTNTINLYAHWEPNSYKVKFDANGGTLSDNIPEEITVKYADSLDLNKYTATLEGYTFGGWAENPNNQSGIAGNIYVQATTNEYTTLYAIYYKNLTINYAVPEGIENAISLSKTKSSCRIFSHENNCIIATPSFTNIGTTDEEKKISISGFKEKDAAEKRFKTNVQATITEDDNGKTFYAIPSDKKVTLRAYLMLGDKLQYNDYYCYLYDGAKTCKVNVVVDWEGQTEASYESVGKYNYLKFNSWSTSPDEYIPYTGNYEISEDTTIYAYFKSTIDVTYNYGKISFETANDGKEKINYSDTSSETKTSTCLVNKKGINCDYAKFKLIDGTYSDKNTFEGWRRDTEDMASYSYKAGDEITPDQSIELYGIYTINTTYKTDDLDMNSVETKEYVGSVYGLLPTPAETGKVYVGWYKEKTGEQITPETIVKSNEDEKVYAKWEDINSLKSDYKYVGYEQAYKAEKDGYYLLETWGAQGGSVPNYHGGYGGYSRGVIYLNKGDTLYINVGGKGNSSEEGTAVGGYNGGGSSYIDYKTTNFISGSGGGATHIARVSGVLENLFESDNLNKVIIVSGGGGGARYESNESLSNAYGNGGSGGGYIGGYAESSSENTDGTLSQIEGTSGTQTSGNIIGKGASSSMKAAGGAGYYGGLGGAIGDKIIGSAGGGSGYIGNSELITLSNLDKHMVCYNCLETNESNIKTISSTCTNEEAKSNCSKIGNGEAKITYMNLMLTFDANGGNVDTMTKVLDYESSYGDLPIPEREDAEFIGWYTEEYAGDRVTSETIAEDVGSKTLYAHWKTNKYIIYFDENNGNEITENKKVVQGNTYGELPTVTRDGYEFVGWYTDSENGDLITSDTTVNLEHDQTLYAHYKANTYEVTLDAQGGTLTSNKVIVTYNSKYNLPTPEKEHSIFTGWYTDPENGTKIDENTKVTSLANETLYAHWIPDYYVVTFNAQGGTVKQTSKTVYYGSTYGNLPVPERSEYTFAGWYTENGELKTSDMDVDITSNTTLYAHWKQIKYDLILNLNEGTYNNSTNDITIPLALNESVDLTQYVPTYEGYIFKGFGETKTSSNVISTYTQNESSNHTLYAIYYKNIVTTFKVTDSNKDILSLDSNEERCELYKDSDYCYVYAPSYTVSDEKYEVAGYVKEETKDGKLNTTVDMTKGTNVNTNETYYAVVRNKTPNILNVYYAENNEVKNDSHTCYMYNHETSCTIDEVKTPEDNNGIAFTNWSTSSSENVKYDGSLTELTTSINLYAYYAEGLLKLTYNYGNITNTNGTITYANTETITNNTACLVSESSNNCHEAEFTLKNEDSINKATLLGWTDDTSDLTTVKYKVNDKLVITKDTTLNAIYGVNITFDGNGQEISLTNNTYYLGTTYNDLPIETNSDYVFAGWYKSTDLTDENVVKNTDSVDSNLDKLYAGWKINNIGYNFDYTGGEQTFIAPKTGYYLLQTWGAAGGYDSARGGYGGYAEGAIGLKKDQKIYICVGGVGASAARYGGGFNGGGGAGYYGTSGAGGGATHIALTDHGILPNYADYKDEILIVAGAGGGGGNSYGLTTGGAGGGLTGIAGAGAMGGTQTSGGAGGSAGTFGQGGQRTGDGGGGGGGYYGGGASAGDGGGAGGSGYIGNTLLISKKFGDATYTKHMSCYNCETSSDVDTRTISNTCVSATPTIDCAKQNNGYARITLLYTELTVTFNPNGGSVSTTTKPIYNSLAYDKLPVPIREGYAFAGWYTDPSSGEEITNDSIVSVHSNQTLYAHWETGAYNVFFDANTGSTEGSSILVHNGSAYGKLPTASKDGYTFTGWYTDPENGDLITSDTIANLIGNQTLYAHYQPNDYKVTLVLEKGTLDGSTSDKEVSLTFDSTYDLNEMYKPTLDGYTFKGWSTEEKSQVVIDNYTQSVSNDNTKLYAVYYKTINVLFTTTDNNKGMVEPDSETEKCDLYSYMSTCSVVSPKFTAKDGYTFLGYVKNTSSTKVDVEANANVNVNADTTYYVLVRQTTALNLKAYYINNGSISSYNYSCYLYNNDTSCKATTSVTTPGKYNNFSFVNWSSTADKNEPYTGDYTITEDTNLYAYYEGVSSIAYNYGVTIKNNNSYMYSEYVVDTSNETCLVDASSFNCSKTPYVLRDGTYTSNNIFAGWTNDTSDFSTVKYTTGSTLETNSNIQLYAIYKINVEFDPNGGIVDIDNKDVYLYSTYGELPTPTRTGYNFGGWYLTNDFDLKDLVSSSTSVISSENHTLYAKWIYKEYDYSYTGEYQTFTAPEDGTYQIELWGASGGNGKYSNYEQTEYGGLGAYTSGNIHLSKGTTIYVYVGGQGTSATSNRQHSYLAGGWNGGGQGTSGGGDDQAGSGGGATDIRIVPTSKTNVWNEEASINSRIMVASGGGGGHTYTMYYDNYDSRATFPIINGIGVQMINGKNGQWRASTYTTSVSQTSGGVFGKGTQYTSLDSIHGAGGGGGGYYGGLANTNGNGGPGTGGTSYISGYTGCVAITSESDTTPRSDASGNACVNGTTDELCSEHYSGYVFANTIMKSGNEKMPSHDGLSLMTGNTSNGYAKITLISSTKNITLNANGGNLNETEVVVNVNTTYGNLPTPTREGYAFVGWYTDSENGDLITSNTTVTADSPTTLYAHWESNSENNAYNIYFDGNGGTTTSSSILVHKGEKYNSLPTAKKDESIFNGWYTDPENGDEITSDSIFNLDVNQTLYAHYINYVSNFDYTGGEQTYTAPQTGYYLLETWGAQGGAARSGGGYGSYSVGVVNLEKNEKLYINVGGTTTNTTAGYNGGGEGGKGRGYPDGAGGGGATSISKISGLLSTQSNNIDDILIVAGGGGGGTGYAGCGRAGSAGGISGISTKNLSNNIASGGTQTTGYQLGLGQNGRTAAEFYGSGAEGNGGGGGGLYGGYAFIVQGWYSNGAGAGGSGYIGNPLLISKNLNNKGSVKHMACYNCETSTDVDTRTISNTCVSATPTIDCAKQNNGYARITFVK